MGEFDNKPIDLMDTGPRWEAERVDNWAAPLRGKRNEVITDADGMYPDMFSKSVKRSASGRDNIQGLQIEFEMLEALKNTGVTPAPLAMKIERDGSEAHLLMEKIEGEPLLKIDISGDTGERFKGIADSIAHSLDRIHRENILVVDINEGTFIIGQENGKEAAYVVDFELAETGESMKTPPAQKKLIDYYTAHDIGMQIACMAGNRDIDMETAKTTEQYLALKQVIERYAGASYEWDIKPEEFEGADRDRYEKQLQLLEPFLREAAEKSLRNEYRNYFANSEGYLSSLGEDGFVKTKVDIKVHMLTQDAMVNITLPYLLASKGLTIPDHEAEKYRKTLSPFLHERLEVRGAI